MLKIEVAKEQDTSIEFKIEGSIDTITARNFEDTISAYYDIENMILDFMNVSYISSSGLRVLLRVNKELGTGNLLLKNVNPEVREVLELTGFDELLTIQN